MRIKYGVLGLCLCGVIASAETLHFEGQIVPLPIAPIIAPFDGVLAKFPYGFGKTMDKNVVFMQFSSPKLEAEILEAKDSLYALQTVVTQKEQWEQSSEMQLAQQQVAQAEQAWSRACDRAHYSEILLKDGIIARQEAELDRQQCDTQIMQRDWAKQQLETVRAQKVLPPGVRPQIQQLQAHIPDLIKKQRDNVKRSPDKGQLWPRESDAKLWEGMMVQEGQVLGDFIAIQTIQVKFHVDEWDIVRLSPGQAVQVQFHAFPGVSVPAVVKGIDAYPVSDAQNMVYAVSVALPVPTELGDQWRFGMRAQVAIVVPDV